jgi:hypothetical protein
VFRLVFQGLRALATDQYKVLFRGLPWMVALKSREE